MERDEDATPEAGSVDVGRAPDFRDDDDEDGGDGSLMFVAAQVAALAPLDAATFSFDEARGLAKVRDLACLFCLRALPGGGLMV